MKQIINCIVVVLVCSVMVNARTGKTRTVNNFLYQVSGYCQPSPF